MYGDNDTNPSHYALAEIQGYASLASVNQGGSINFYVRTINTNSYTLSVFRMGWYNGLGGRLMLGPITLAGVVQPMPPPPVYQPAGSGIVECNWSLSYSLTIPTDWVSGVYLVKLSLSSPAAESYIVFVVRDDARNSPILVQSSVATYQAYNEWGGSSLYTTVGGVKTGYEVSFNRPYWRNYGAGDFISLNGAPGYEMQLVRWLESLGYDVTYVTDVDTHENPNLPLSHKVFLVVGHDEYWSRSMRDNVTRGRDAGVHLGFLGANLCYWQIRFAPSSTGVLDRTIVGYKELAAMDPVSDPRYVTTLWRDLNEPEGALIGVQYNDFSAPTVSDMVVTNASHWLFGGTGVSNGTIFPNVVGYETDSLYPPAGAIGLAHSPFPRGSPQVYADMSIYTAPSGANVFATGTIEWSLGLDSFPPSQGALPAVQQVTANFLSRALQSIPPPLVGSVNPSSGAQGQNLSNVVITGSNFQSGATCSFGVSITVNSCTFNSAAQITASISISSTATVGTRNVTVTNPDTQSGTLPNGFTVTTSGPTPPPSVSSVNPNSRTQGQSLPSVIITGGNFQSGATCSFGAGITVNSCTFNSATQLTASITISSTATVGTRNVTVTNPDSQTGTLPNGFSVTAPPAISLIQKVTFSRQPTSSGTVTLTLPQATGAGHAIIVGLSFWPLDISSVTDGSGDAFTRGLATSVFHNVSGSATYTNFYYAKASAGGTTSLTMNFSGGSTYLLVAVAEVSGLNSSAPLDQSGYHESLTATTAWSSAAVTTMAANEYLFSWAATEAGNPPCSSPAAGWMIESQTNDSAGATVCLLDRVVSATGTYQASVTASTAQNYAMEIAAFKGSAPSGPPPTPTGLTATAGNSQVSLTWNTSTGAASYNLYRSVNGGAYSQLNTSPITTTSYTDSGLTNGTSYCYEATAVNSSGESAKSSPACATPQPPPPPPTPTGLTATAGNAQVSLVWNASTGAASYNLYRSVNGGAYSQLNTSTITTTSYTDSGLTNGTPYCYEATAVNSSGESAKSSPACATPQPPPPPPAISLIQKATFSREPTSGGTVTLTLPQATGAGHTLIVGVSFWPLDISSVTDGSGDAFTRGLTTSIYHNVSGSATYTNFYYAKSLAGGTTSLTLNFSGGSTYLLVAVAEVAGLNPSAPLDQSGFHESLTATTAWSSATVTTTTASEYLFSWAATEAGNPPCSTPASGWTIESQTNDPSGATVCWLDRIVSATGSYQASVTAGTGQNYAMEIVTFK
jgi:hypothetical protein